MNEQKFLICKHCGNLVGVIHGSGVPIICCGEPMTEIVPNTVDASHEKHLPVVSYDGHKYTVTVGSVLHPMEDKHYIQWLYFKTAHGGMRHVFQPGDKPEWSFCGNWDKPVAVYAYCNLHGLWMTEIK